METIWLRVRAPFAAFRRFQAGSYRPSWPVMPPSTAYGLILNLAGIEMRGPLNTVTTGIRDGLPRLRIALGLISDPGRSTLYQQLHGYPVGDSGGRLKERTHGAKFFITPVRRELLVVYDGMIGFQSIESDLPARVRQTLAGGFGGERYGLPFAGDNNFMIDRLDLLDEPLPALWYERLDSGDRLRSGAIRLPVGIDRADNSRTTSEVYVPGQSVEAHPPESAWTWTPADWPKASGSK